MRTKDSSLAGWGVFAGAAPDLATGYTGPFANLRARFRAAALNWKDR